jgi:hypothetical protein
MYLDLLYFSVVHLVSVRPVFLMAAVVAIVFPAAAAAAVIV